MNKKELKEQLLDFAESYIEAYNQDWEGYDDALDFAQDGNTLAGLILEYFNED